MLSALAIANLGSIRDEAQVKALSARIENLHEQIEQLKLERGGGVSSVFEKFDKDDDSFLSRKEFHRMVSSGAVTLSAEKEYSPFCLGSCQDCKDDCDQAEGCFTYTCSSCKNSNGEDKLGDGTPSYMCH